MYPKALVFKGSLPIVKLALFLDFPIMGQLFKKQSGGSKRLVKGQFFS